LILLLSLESANIAPTTRGVQGVLTPTLLEVEESCTIDNESFFSKGKRH